MTYLIFRLNNISKIPPGTGYRLLKIGICLFLAVCLLVISHNAFAWPFRSDLNSGNDLYKKGNYSQADNVYGKILEKKKNDSKARFNLGDSLYKEGKYKESQEEFKSLTDKSVDKNLRQGAFYNLGNSFFKQEDYKSAIGAYEESLKINPKDKDAQFNLELAKKMLAMPRQEKDKQKEDQKDKQQKEDEKKKNDQKQKDDKSGNKDKEQKQPQQRNPGQMSKEDALRILNALEDKEKHKDQKLKAGRGGADVKDW
jgi:tetratricopeptide (TPR) repeat protein